MKSFYLAAIVLAGGGLGAFLFDFWHAVTDPSATVSEKFFYSLLVVGQLIVCAALYHAYTH